MHGGGGPLMGRLRWSRGVAELTLISVVAAAVAAFYALGLPAHGDMSAHLYRTLLVRRGDYLWDNLWYRGDYPLASYSVLYYFLAAWFGNAAVVIAATIAEAVLYAMVVARAWGRQARATAWGFAVFAAEPLVRSEYPFALGVAFMLATLATLQRGRVAAAAVFAALSLASSPLAFGFLCLALAGVFVARPVLERRPLIVASILLVLTGVYLAGAHLVRMPWSSYPFSAANLVPVLVVSGLAAAFALRMKEARSVAGVSAVWGLAAIAGFLISTPLGLNLERPIFMCAPLLLVPVSQMTRRNVRAGAALAVCAVLSFVGVNLAFAAGDVFRPAPGQSRLWASAVAFLRTHQTPDFRVEVVPTAAHWEAYYLPSAGFAIARGWYRQLDLAANGVLYRSRISPNAYRRWLAGESVNVVILVRTIGLDGNGAQAEAQLLRSGRSGLVLVRRTRDWYVFAVRHPVPLLRPGTLGKVTAFAPERIAAVVRQPGVYRLDVTYMPFWEAPSSVIVQRGPDGTTILRIRKAGRFVLAASGERLLGLG
jgi:hypothetical protein